MRATALKTGEQNLVRFPGARPCPVRNAEQWERNSLGVVSVAGCRPDISVCQHPIFNFQNTRKPKLENTKKPGTFKGLLQSSAPSGAAVLSDGRVIWATSEPVNGGKSPLLELWIEAAIRPSSRDLAPDRSKSSSAE